MESCTKSESPHRDGSSQGDAVRQVTYIGNFLSIHGLNPTYSELLVPELRRSGYRVQSASSFWNPFLRLADVVQKILRTPRRRACVIIDLYSGPRAFHAACLASDLCAWLGKPYVLVLHGGTLPDRLKHSGKALVRILSRAARIVSPSRYLASSLVEVCQAEIIPNAINLADYPFRQRGPVEPKCFYLRALHRNYGPLVGIEALALASKKLPSALLRMAGPEMDGCRPECEQLIASHGLSGRVTLLGRISKSEIQHEGNRADIFINPTFVDNTPVSVVEAMAMGLCIIATNVGGLPYLLKDGHTALLIPPRDAGALADKICQLVANPDLARTLSRNARAEAESMDWSCVLPHWKRIVESVCQN
jgi:glycosyltransferase involved in cell wall biosynthesis